MQEALRALLLGQAQQRHWVPALAQAGAPSVQRSVDLLHLYGLLVPEEDRPQVPDLSHMPEWLILNCCWQTGVAPFECPGDSEDSERCAVWQA